MMKLLKKTKKTPKVIVYLQILGICLFFILILLSALLLGTTEKNLKKMTRVFADSVEVDTEYYENYKIYGFTDEMCRELLEGDKIKGLTADVLTDRFLAIFKNTSSYSLTLDECKERIRGYIKETAGGLELDETKVNALADYTCDISGISTMFIYNTPDEYRTSIFEADREKIEGSDNFLKFLSTLASPVLWGIMLLFYIVTLVMIYVLDKGVFSMHSANTALYPSVAVLGFSIGEIFMPDASVVTDYIFRLLMITSVGGTVVGLIMYFIIRFLKEGSETDEEVL